MANNNGTIPQWITAITGLLNYFHTNGRSILETVTGWLGVRQQRPADRIGDEEQSLAPARAPPQGEPENERPTVETLQDRIRTLEARLELVEEARRPRGQAREGHDSWDQFVNNFMAMDLRDRPTSPDPLQP